MHHCSFISKSDLSIATNISNLGVAMGTNDIDKNNAVVALKFFEVNRMTMASKNPAKKQVPYSNIEEEDSNKLDEVLDHICRELTESFDEDSLG